MATVVSVNTITAVATIVLSAFMRTSLYADSCLHLLEHGRRGFLTPERPRELGLGWPGDSRAPGVGVTGHEDVTGSRNRRRCRRFLECADAMPTADLGIRRVGIGFVPTNTDRIA